ncbi:MAG TPA: bifunctional adenosylcobinamide kinase/adenosylcobinamide-phosphate guanylyltransferase [Anaerolineales bacterium]|nr:bifunctional adenosylcobinamide kinase/adenosylcobinamide-phosphate guanylyltransferase [Anaerolineales bacterium]
MGNLVLFLGGARSGKSSLAERMAQDMGGDSVLYVATAEARDDEMVDRIEKHQVSRPAAWRTLEEPRQVTAALRENYQGEKVIMLDCMTLLVTNLLPSGVGFEQVEVDVDEYERVVMEEIEDLLDFIRETDVTFLLVSNEVGLGLVPAYELGRAYRDILGRVNKVLAEAAAKVHFMVAGIPMQIK